MSVRPKLQRPVKREASFSDGSSPLSSISLQPLTSPSMTTFSGGPVFRFVSAKGDDSDSADGIDANDTSLNGMQLFRASGACVHCKSLKVKCEFHPSDRLRTICKRCAAGNHQCIPRTRKKRKEAPTHEDLQERSFDQDRQIQTLLQDFDKIRTDRKIRDWMAKAQSETTSDGKISERGDMESFSSESPVVDRLSFNSNERAVIEYFPGKGAQHLPDIVRYCNLLPEDITNLFQIFFDAVNPYFSILDRDYHTPERLIWKCPFLFTVICSIASRYYKQRPNLYQVAKEFPRDQAGKALIDGTKSVDICQAYLLMGVYPVPKKSWEEDRSWLLMGVAIRMALELGLNGPSPSNMDPVEALDRRRTWLNCFCVDSSHSIQYGKMPMISLDDYMARTSSDWWMSSKLNNSFDIHLCAYCDIFVLLAEWHRLSSNLERAVPVAIDFDNRISNTMDMWKELYEQQRPDSMCKYRGNTTLLISAYLRLVVLSHGFRSAFKRFGRSRGLEQNSQIVKKSIQAAKDVIRIVVFELYPTGLLAYAMDANFLYVSFAAAFLINLLRPKFLPLLAEDQQCNIVADVQNLIVVLGSRGVALNNRHTPMLYSRFLKSLLAKHYATPASPIEDLSPKSSAGSPAEPLRFIPQYSAQRQQTPPEIYAWPDSIDTQMTDTDAQNFSPSSSITLSPGADMIYQLPGDADMDFTMNNFVSHISAQNAHYQAQGWTSPIDMTTTSFQYPASGTFNLQAMRGPDPAAEMALYPNQWI